MITNHFVACALLANAEGGYTKRILAWDTEDGHPMILGAYGLCRAEDFDDDLPFQYVIEGRDVLPPDELRRHLHFVSKNDSLNIAIEGFEYMFPDARPQTIRIDTEEN